MTTNLAALIRQAKSDGLIPTQVGDADLWPWMYAISVGDRMLASFTLMTAEQRYEEALMYYRKEYQKDPNRDIRFLRRRLKTDEWEQAPLPENY